MDVREKLVELIRCADYHPCGGSVRKIGSMFTTEFIEDIASQLIDNGVTVQDLGGCDFCKKYDFSGARAEVNKYGAHISFAICNTKFPDEERLRFCPMCGRRLPQPPKGE